jgi:hypothetical protein
VLRLPRSIGKTAVEPAAELALADNLQGGGHCRRVLAIPECFAMIIKTSAFSLSAALFAGVAAAQTLSGPTVNRRHLQPTEQQVESRQGDRAREWNARVQSEIDRLYGEIMHAATRVQR